MSSPTPTGTVGDGPGGREIRLTRRFRARPEDVWAALTESDRLERWIGRWEGDPSTGTVTFFMTAEGDDVEAEPMTIVECEPPHRFAAETAVGGQQWHVRWELAAEGDITTLTFAQLAADDEIETAGPGWEYYLDRLVTVLDGGDVRSVQFADYFPAMRGYYADLVS